MVTRMKTSHLLFLLLLLYLSSGMIEGVNGMTPTSMLHQGRDKMNSRKLLGHESVLDYDDPGANPKHDPPPPRGKRGGGGRNN